MAAAQKMGGYAALAQALTQSPEQLLAAVETSGLRGRGGAGFPTGRKWRAVAAQPAGTKYVVANADEGDAGAYIDRYIMEDDPHALIEGMILSCWANDVKLAYLYIRGEMPQGAKLLNKALDEARAKNFLGKNILGSGSVSYTHLTLPTNREV